MEKSSKAHISYCLSLCLAEVLYHCNKPWWWHSGLKDLFGFCFCISRFWHRLHKPGVLSTYGSICVLFWGFMLLFISQNWELSMLYRSFWTLLDNLPLLISLCLSFFYLTCVYFDLDFDACFIFLILFTNTSSSESDSSSYPGEDIL